MKTILSIFAVMCLALTACAQNKEKAMDNEKPKTLVAYYSATGTTQRAAERLAKEVGGELYEITPAVLYTDADLNWNNRQSRSSVEMNDEHSRPELGGNDIDVAQYDTIYVGYPIWWDQAPRVVYTFIDKHDFAGKVIIPFATSGGSSVNGSVRHMRATYPDLKIEDGKLMR